MKWLFFYSLFWMITFGNLIYGQEFHLLKQEFNNSNVLPNVQYGFSLYDLDNHNYLLNINEGKYFTPASNTKLFTLYSALTCIGDSIPGMEYVVKGDSLIFWGTGDPTFLHPHLDNGRVFNWLKNSDKKLFYVPQMTTEPSYRNGWSIEDYQDYYQPEITSFPIYGNLVNFYEKAGKLHTHPRLFETNLKTTVCDHSSKFAIVRDHHTNTFSIHGDNIPKGYQTNKPFIVSDSLLVHLLQDTLHKPVTLIKSFPKPKKTTIVYSVPRNIVLREMMLPSDNFLAEQLTLLGANLKYQSFSTEKLRNEMFALYFNQFQDSIVLRDGSGLSTYNKVTPRSMVELLQLLVQKIPQDPKRYLFFPAGGVDGTLKSVYEMDQGEPFVFAKTGTINAVHCQSGYLVTRTGKRLAFSFLTNNYVIPTSIVRQEIARLITFIRHNY